MRTMTMIAAVVVSMAAQACAAPVGTPAFQAEGSSEQASTPKTTMCGTFQGSHGYQGTVCPSGQVVGGSCTWSAGTNHGSHLDTDVIGRTVWACEADLPGAVAGNVEICSTVECQ